MYASPVNQQVNVSACDLQTSTGPVDEIHHGFHIQNRIRNGVELLG